MTPEDSRDLDGKRRKLTSILVERATERWECLQANEAIDVNVREVFERPSRSQIAKDVERLPESHLDYCLEQYDDSGPQYVY